jgi:uncharacterized membrane protein YukC
MDGIILGSLIVAILSIAFALYVHFSTSTKHNNKAT